MATKAEAFRSDQQRKAPKKAKSRKAHASKVARKTKMTAPHERAAAAKKASYAVEGQSVEDRTVKRKSPTRKSTRKAANRSKADSNLTLREGRTKGSPENRARKARAKVKRVRAHTR